MHTKDYIFNAQCTYNYFTGVGICQVRILQIFKVNSATYCWIIKILQLNHHVWIKIACWLWIQAFISSGNCISIHFMKIEQYKNFKGKRNLTKFVFLILTLSWLENRIKLVISEKTVDRRSNLLTDKIKENKHKIILLYCKTKQECKLLKNT